MSDQRPEIARLSFSGQHYDEGVIDATVLKELLCFQNILTEMAKSVWKRQNPERKRLPKDFDDRTRFVLRNIKDGSVVIPLEMLRRSNQMDLFGDTDDVIKKAVELIYNTFTAANCDKPLPPDVPKELLLSLSEFGERLSDNARMRFAVLEREMIPISRQTRQRFKILVEDFYEDEIEITGRVLEADVRQKRFQIWEDDQTNTTVSFTETQESEVTTALKEHSSTQLLVKGQGKFNKDGVLQGIRNVKRLRIISDNKTEFDVSAPRIEDVIAEIFSDVPDHEWDKIPRDLSHRHDFYLYGDGEE